MRRRLTIPILLVALVIMGALLWSQSQQPPPPPTQPFSERPLSRVFPDLAVLDIISVRLLDPDSGVSFTIARDSAGEWSVPDSDQTLRENAGSDIARTIALLPYTRTIPLDADSDLGEFGFNPNGTMFVQVLLRDGSGHTVAVGGVSPTVDGYYALVDDEETLYFLLTEAVAFLITQLRTPPLAS
jgi:hypothetical protein